MKKISAFLMVLFLLSFCFCPISALGAGYAVEKDGKTFEVDATENTIFDGTYTYAFTFSGNSENYSIHISYPNGASYFWHQSDGTGYGGWSNDYDETMYMAGDTLCEIIMYRAPKPYNPGKILGGIFLILIGGFCLIAPKAAWFLDTGWRFEYAKPSEAALFAHQVSGVIAIAAGIILFFV